MQLADSLEVRIIFGQDDARDIELRNGQAVLLKANFDLFAQGGRNERKLFVYLEYIYIVCLYDRRQISLHRTRNHRAEGSLQTLRKA